MVPFNIFHPGVLAIAQDLQRRCNLAPEVMILDHLKAIIEEKPPLMIEDYTKMAQQINDLMAVSTPPDDRLRFAMMIFLPQRRGTLFVAEHMLMRDALFFAHPPCLDIAPRLAKALDGTWDQVLETLKKMPLPPAPLMNGGGVPPEAHHPAASGPMPANIQEFLKP